VAPESILYFTANFALFALVLLRWLDVRRPGRVQDRVSGGALFVFAALQGAAVIWSVVRSGVVSIVHPWLATMVMVEATVLLCLLLVKGTAVRAVGAITVTLAFVIHSYSLLLGPPPMQTGLVVSPFARSPWYLLHALGAVVASAAYVCAAGGAMAYLGVFVAQRGAPTKKDALQRESQEFWRRALLIAFPWLAGSVLAHALWTYLSWGSYWSWRPAGICVLILWLLLAMTLHIRPRPRWQGPAAALLALLGLVLALVSLTLLGQGLIAT
jgi:ABC-type transport system involved in cytochrome c biogenesis permease subunit